MAISSFQIADNPAIILHCNQSNAYIQKDTYMAKKLRWPRLNPQKAASPAPGMNVLLAWPNAWTSMVLNQCYCTECPTKSTTWIKDLGHLDVLNIMSAGPYITPPPEGQCQGWEGSKFSSEGNYQWRRCWAGIESLGSPTVAAKKSRQPRFDSAIKRVNTPPMQPNPWP